MTESIEGAGAADKARIVRAAGLVMALYVASRALGLLREMVISHQFGTGGDLDAYLAAFRLPDILFQVIAGGALASAFIPTYAGYLTRGDEKGGWRLASSPECARGTPVGRNGPGAAGAGAGLERHARRAVVRRDCPARLPGGRVVRAGHRARHPVQHPFLQQVLYGDRLRDPVRRCAARRAARDRDGD